MNAPGDHESLRLWLRLFTCSTLIEQHLGSALKREFGSSLPRFDLLAQLDRAPGGLRMGELSERILTTGGNVTWLVRALETEGLVSRRVAIDDKRAAVVRLTAAGRRHFAAMAQAHEQWIIAVFAPLTPDDRRLMHEQLDTLKAQFRPSRTTE
ncbi:MAG: MarR family transcriptional regulator [Gemmatimonadaceae bacterium]|nr:MarR family transcriptional regulator [Gemmatimonadaceae bacterium]